MGGGACKDTKTKRTGHDLVNVNKKANAANAAERSYLFKILFVGDSGCGKTSLLLRYVDDSFTDTFISTIGVDFKSKTITLEGSKVEMQIWDTAGQERFRTITSSYYRGAEGVILVFDLTNPESFNNVKRWLTDVEKYSGDSAHKILVGNKSDLASAGKVDRRDAEEFASRFNIEYIETSAKNGVNVATVFEKLVYGMKQAEDNNA
jgi:Ras-related protein Rab-1A